MPITFELLPDQKCVIIRHFGEVPDHEFIAFYRDFFQKPDTDDYQKMIVDLGQTKSVARSSQALQSLAELLRKKTEDSALHRKVAVIAPADLSFGLARMYEMFSGPVKWEFVVFRDREAAHAWLGISRNSGPAGYPHSV